MRSLSLAPLLLGLLASSTVAEPVKPPAPPAPGVVAAAATQTQFSRDLLTQLLSQPGNVFCSPLSVHIALDMARAGAKGPTLDAMSRALHVEEPEASRQMASLRETIRASTQGRASRFQLDSANRLWTSEGLKLTDGYAAKLKDGFGADAKDLDFSNKAASADAVNNWVAKQTSGMIPVLLDPGSIPDAGFILTNAVYFKALWKHPFDKARTRPDAFTLESGEKAQVPMMHRTDDFGYAKLPSLAALSLPYRGDASMVVVLPDEGKMPEVIAGLDLSTIRAALSEQEVRVTMPKVDIKTRCSIRPALIGMGLGAAFDPTADFTGITPTGPAYLSDVIHAAALKMDEEKTEAAAATGVIAKVEARVPIKVVEFTVDRPFLVFILHEPTGAVLFAGRIADPRK